MLPAYSEIHPLGMKSSMDGYQSPVSRSNSGKSVHWSPSIQGSSQAMRQSEKSSAVAIRRERYVYAYRLAAGRMVMEFYISVEPHSGKPTSGECTFRLSFKANGIERPLCEPTIRKLQVDPRRLEFVVFAFPCKSSIPASSLWSLRVWLNVNGTNHWLFGEDELWIGRDLDFNSIKDAAFARLKVVDSKRQLYHGFVGRALVTFTVHVQHLRENVYRYSMEYEAKGVGKLLFDDLELKIDGNPLTLMFLIYTVPVRSQPPGASHLLRVWLRSAVQLSSDDPSGAFAIPFNDSYVYQRVWKDDTFRIGAGLDFGALQDKIVVGSQIGGGPRTITDVSPEPASASASASASSSASLSLATASSSMLPRTLSAALAISDAAVLAPERRHAHGPRARSASRSLSQASGTSSPSPGKKPTQ